jgi:hypothetical protein
MMIQYKYKYKQRKPSLGRVVGRLELVVEPPHVIQGEQSSCYSSLDEGHWQGTKVPRVPGRGKVVAHNPTVALRDLNHVLVAGLTRSTENDVVARQTDDALDALELGEHGGLEADNVADGDASATAVGHVHEEVVALDGKGGQHGGPAGGGLAVAVVPGEVGGGGDFEGGAGDAEGVGLEVFNHGGGGGDGGWSGMALGGVCVGRRWM